MSTQIRRSTREIIPAGNDFTLYIHLDKWDDGQYRDFDLHTATDLRVYLICAVHNTEIDLDYTITSSDCLKCDVDYRLLHINTSYGVVVEGYDAEDKHFRWTMMPREGLLVVPNTSGMNTTDDVEEIDLQGRVGWGITSAGVHADWDETDPLDPGYIKHKPDLSIYLTAEDLEGKQDTLVSGENIKTINNISLLGSGNINIQGGGGMQVQADWDESNTSSPAYIQNKPDMNDYVEADDLPLMLDTELRGILNPIAFSGDYNDLQNQPDLSDYQELLVSGTNIKTINNQSLLGSGDITISGSGVQADWAESDSTDPSYIQNKPDLSNYATQADLSNYATQADLADYQELLVSGTNIKTINNQSLLGSGNITISGSGVQADWAETDTTDPSYIQNKPDMNDYVEQNDLPSLIYNQMSADLNPVAFSGDYYDLYNQPDLTNYQEILISGGNIKTINNQSLLGSGDITISGGEHDYSKDYLTFEALESGTFTFTRNALQYSLDNGATWTTLAAGTASPTLATGEKILWKQTGLTPTSSYGIGTFSSTGNFIAQGNVMSLYYGDNFVGETDLTGKSYAFDGLFNSCSKLKNVENLVLPATTLDDCCYYYMFYCCTALVTAPALPATTLEPECYRSMFESCSRLTTAPALPATTLASNCYSHMFSNCTSLTIAPELPATTLDVGCYRYMFNGCSNLTTAPVLPATTLEGSCYNYMFCGCSKLNYIKAMFTTTPSTSYTNCWLLNVAATGIFIKSNNATWTDIGSYAVPSGWISFTEDEYSYVRHYELSPVAISADYDDLNNKPDLSNYATVWDLADYQELLVSGTNIKTINNQSLLGSGDITISGGGDPGFIKVTNGNKTGLVSSLATHYNTNIGDYATIEGDGWSNGNRNSQASGNYSHVEGEGNQANGEAGHAEGVGTYATGYAAHAEGRSSQANGWCSHVEGDSGRAEAQYSHVEGYSNVSNSNAACSHVEGIGNITNNHSEHGQGWYGSSTNGMSSNFKGDGTTTLHYVGNGNGSQARHNAFEIKQNGDIYYVDTEKIDGSTVHYYDAPMRKLQDAMVTSTTNGVKIAVVNAMPATPDSNTLYVVI